MKNLIAFLLVIAIAIFSSCSMSGERNGVKKSEYLLGTLVSITVYDFGEADKTVIDECFRYIAEYEQIFSFNISESELSNVNNMAFHSPVHISEPLYDIISKSLVYCKKSNGAFDIGLGKLIEIWDKATLNGIPPTSEMISPYVGFNGYKYIILDEEQKTVIFTDERVAIHLGACAKGYLEDKAVVFLKEKGVKSALLDFGGSISVIGDKFGDDFSIGITDPFNTIDLVGVIGISDKSAVTSGDYRRYFEYDKVRYHHILDSKTAFPVDSGIHGVTIVCDSAFKGDCLSTAAFALGYYEASAMLASEDCGYIIITDDAVYTDGVVLKKPNE